MNRGAVLGGTVRRQLGRVAAGAVLGGLLSACGGTLSWDDAKDHVGDNEEVCGPMMSIRHTTTSAGGDITLINIGVDYPDPARFTFVLVGQSMGDHVLDGSTTACGSGEIYLFRGLPQIRTDSVATDSSGDGNPDPPDPYVG